MENYNKILNAVQAKCIGTSDNNLKTKLESIFNKIEDENKIKDINLFRQRKESLIEMAKGSLKNAFTLDRIKAAIHNYQ